MYNPMTPPQPQESYVTLCRKCMETAGYLTRKVNKKPVIDKNTKNLFPEPSTTK
jgi:hypothetical protein